MGSLIEFPVLPAVLVSTISFILGCWYFRLRGAAVSYLNWLLAFLFLLLGALDLLIEKKLWPGIAAIFVIGICEAVLLYYWVARMQRKEK
jgi:hypothetical protein